MYSSTNLRIRNTVRIWRAAVELTADWHSWWWTVACSYVGCELVFDVAQSIHTQRCVRITIEHCGQQIVCRLKTHACCQCWARLKQSGRTYEVVVFSVGPTDDWHFDERVEKFIFMTDLRQFARLWSGAGGWINVWLIREKVAETFHTEARHISHQESWRRRCFAGENSKWTTILRVGFINLKDLVGIQ